MATGTPVTPASIARGATIPAALALLVAAAVPATAGPVEDRVRAAGHLRCGAVEQPDLAEPGPDGAPAGAALDYCRAVARELLGPGATVELRLYPDATGPTRDDLVFLASDSLGANPTLLPGPVLQRRPLTLLVADPDRIRSLADLGGQPVCFEIGSPAHAALEAASQHQAVAFIRLAHSEIEEMRDAYAAGQCVAMAAEADDLIDLQQTGPARLRRSRTLPEPIGERVIMAAVPTGDPAWAETVAQALRTAGLSLPAR